MEYSREQIITLRKMMIKYNIERDLQKITNLLIDYPKMVNVVTDLEEVSSKYVKREYFSTGHGAFGEPEGYTNKYICGNPIENRKNIIFLDEDNIPIYADKRIDIESLIVEIKGYYIDDFKL